MEIAWGELCWTGASDERGWTVKRGNGLEGALQGATAWMDCEAWTWGNKTEAPEERDGL